MESVKNSLRSAQKKHQMMNLLVDAYKSLARETVIFIDKSYTDGKITLQDYDEMTKALENLSSYMNDKYCKYSDIEKEVAHMVKTFIDPKIQEEARKEERIIIAKNLLDVLDVETIAKKIGLTVDEIEKLKH
jgi:hypothetical protein